MRKLFFAIFAFIAAINACAQADYQATQAKADRFFANREWGSATALYNYLLHEKPNDTDNYGRDIVASEMINDSIRSMQLLAQAMNYGAPLDSVLYMVRKYSFQVGADKLYENFMLQAAREYKWMERPLDAYLLRYYAFRKNAPKMTEYAQKMLKSTPNNVEFLSILAEAQLIQNKPQEAVATWKKILEADPENYHAILCLANYYDLYGEQADAASYFKKAYAIRHTPYVAEKLGIQPPK